ncbi:MAG: hypothetical protein GWP08_12320 [Nitrospiraceae bacterium]|nr:hypothetical protein [Nitrospiraceae bacterium]
MKRFSFSTFKVQDVNRDAFDACHAVAELQPSDRQPLVLLGDHGVGKTHLMYSIVNALRAGTAPVGLAYVTAREFPREVRMLVTDPTPVEKAEHAVLLVDQLEDFTEHVEQLQAVVQIFLDSHHYVVLGTSIHPSRLRALPEDLRKLLEQSRTVTLRPRPAPPSSDASPEDADALVRAQEESRQLRERVAQLDEQLQRTEKKAAVVGQVDQLRRELQAQMDRASENAGAADEVAELRRQLQKAAEQAERAAAKLTHGSEQRKALSEQLDAAEKKARQAANEAAGLRNQLEEQLRSARERDAAAAENADALGRQLDKEREKTSELAAQISALQQEAGETDQRIDALLEQVEQNRAELGRAEQQHRERVRELQALAGSADAERLPPVPLGDTEFAGSARVSEANESARSHLAIEQELARMKAEAAQARRAHDEVLDKLDRLTAEHAQLELEADRVRQEFVSQAGDMDALRHEAAAQVAAANAQAGEIERKYVELYSSLDGARQTEYAVAEGLEGLRRRLIDTSDTMAELASKLAEEENGAPEITAQPQGPDQAGAFSDADDPSELAETAEFGGGEDAPHRNQGDENEGETVFEDAEPVAD